MPKVTPKQERLVLAYIACGNGAEAARVAGYPAHAAKATASEILRKPHVRAFLDAKLAEYNSDLVADGQEVLRYLTAVMRGESRAHVVVVEGQGDGYSEARVVEKPPDEREKLDAAKALAKRYGLLVDKMEVTGPVTVVVEDDYGDNLPDDSTVE